MPRIYRCVCTNTSFTELLVLARRRDLSLPELAERTGASDHCGRCRPYLRRMLQTGETEFHQLLGDDSTEDVEDGQPCAANDDPPH